MTWEEKNEIIDEIKDKLENTSYFYITNFENMDVGKTNKFREMIYKKGLEYKVYKNTLIAKALQNMDTTVDYSEFEEKVLVGHSGIIFSEESGNAPAKLLKEFYGKEKDEEKHWPKLKAASLEEAVYIGHDKLDMLSKIKSKDELLGDVVGLLQSPMKNVLSALQGGSGQKIAGLIKALEGRAE